MARKRKNTQARRSPTTKPEIFDRPWYKKTWPWIAGGAVIISWVLLNGVTALSNAERLPADISRIYKEIVTWYQTDQDWTGKWSNEGDVGYSHEGSIYVTLDLLVRGRSVQGTISSGPQQKAIPLEFVLLEGAVTNDTLDVLAFDFFQGKPMRIATFKISAIESKGLSKIKLTTIWQSQPWFPKETELWSIGKTDLISEQE